MFRQLLSATALVAAAGIASAQGVVVSGDASLGLVGGDAYGGDIEFHTDIDITFVLVGETDNGLSFGASIDLDESDGNPSGAFGNRTQGGETIFISGAFGTLRMGDTDSALDWALTDISLGGSIDDAEEHAGWSDNDELDGIYDGQFALYEYTFGEFSFAASLEIDDTDVGDPTFALGAKYIREFGPTTLAIGAAYQKADDGGATGDAEMFAFSLDAEFETGFEFVVTYRDNDAGAGFVARNGVDSFEHYGVAAAYETGPWTFAANWGRFDNETTPDAEGYALLVNYKLGGGAEVQAAYANSDVGRRSTDQFSFGVSMTF